MRRVALLLLLVCHLEANNQTSFVTLPLKEEPLPFRLSITKAPFSLPRGLQSYAFGRYKDEWVLIAGKTNGLHGFDEAILPTFPAASQNMHVYIINFKKGTVISRSLLEPSSHLSTEQLSDLSVSSSQFFQNNQTNTLYLLGGYGVNFSDGTYDTKSVLTAIDVPNLIKWVKNTPHAKSVAKCIHQISHPLLRVTGGALYQANTHQPCLLALGQNFPKVYEGSLSNGMYTHQIRPFQILDNGDTLTIQPYRQPIPIATYRRRDLNIVPAIKKKGNALHEYYIALGGVFTPGLSAGAWTVPIEIETDGSSTTYNPLQPSTFAQGMNNYSCPTAGLYSKKRNDMYTLLFGGISFYYSVNGGFYSSTGSFTENPNLGFTSDVTTIRIDSSGKYEQYLMSATYPAIEPTFGTDPAAALLFGATSAFFPSLDLPTYSNSVIALDQLGSSPLILGYIVGGIQSSMPETMSDVTDVDTRSSPYIFTVTLIPK